jgi:hypothetical protein
VTTDPVDTSLLIRIKVGHQPRYLLALLWVGLVLLGLIFFAPNTTLIVHILVALVGGAVAFLGFLILPQFNYLELHRGGFVLRNLRAASSYRWRDVRQVQVFTWRGREVIGLELSPEVIAPQRGQHRARWGWDLVLAAHYELSAPEIVEMMNAYRLK